MVFVCVKKCVKRDLTEIQTIVVGLALECYQTFQNLTRFLSLMYTRLLPVYTSAASPSTPAGEEERQQVVVWEEGSRGRPIKCLALN